MSFKENLLLKIEINRLADQVLATLGPSDSGPRLDKDAMRKLLEMSPFEFRRERDLDLYLKKAEDGLFILVLDNELWKGGLPRPLWLDASTAAEMYPYITPTVSRIYVLIFISNT